MVTIELQHERDRKRFRKQNLRLANHTEFLMHKMRGALGLPETPKGSEKFKVIPFKPNTPRD